MTVEQEGRTAEFVSGNTPGTGRGWIYRVSPPLEFEKWEGNGYVPAGSTCFAVVSWGREGDTAIFPADETGRIQDFMPVYTAGYWKNHDEAMNDWVAGLDREVES